MRGIICALLAICTVVTTSIANAQECPDAPKQISKDVDAKVRTEVGRIGALRGAELEARVRTSTKDLLGALNGADKIYLEQMMFAAYCSAIRDDTKLSGSEKARQILEYRKLLQESLRSLGAPNQKPAAQTKSQSFSAAVLSVNYNKRYMGHPEFWVAHLDNGETVAVDSETNKVLRRAKCAGMTGQGLAIVPGPRGSSSTPKYFVAVWCDFKVNMYSLENPSSDFALTPETGSSGWAGEFTLAASSNAFASSGIGPCVYQWELAARAATQSMHCEQRIDTIAMHVTSPLLLTAASDGTVSFWELIDRAKQRWSVKLEKSSDNYGASIIKLGFSDKGRLVYAASNGPKVYLLDPVNGSSISVSHQAKVTITDATLDRQGDLLATGGTDGRVIVWLAKDGTKVWTFEHDEAVSKIGFSSDSRFLVSTSEDKSIRVWSLESGKETSRVDSERACRALAVHAKSDGDYILAGTGRRLRTQNEKSGQFLVREWRLSASGKLTPIGGT